MKAKTRKETLETAVQNNGEIVWEAAWETSAPVQVRSNGAKKSLSAKVSTTGVVVLRDARIWWAIKDSLRHGKEVRLADAGGNEFVRFFPMINIKENTLYPVAQTIGVFRKTAYDQIAPCYSWRGKEVAASGVKAANEIRDFASVTPDRVVRCPKCNYVFRVGKPKENK